MIDCTKTVNYLKEKQRMCNLVGCLNCPLGRENNGKGMFCTRFTPCYPEEAVEIVQRWSDEHPQKTYLSEFLRHYPNASLDENGTPEEICPHALGLMSMNCCRDDYACVKCWNQPIEERKKE